MACGSPVAAADPTPTGLRFVTVTFCDIAGSTRLATSLNPEVWHGVLSDYFHAMSAVVEAAGGRVEKFIGDAVVGVFGADHPADDDAARAVRACLEGLRAMARRPGRAEDGGHGVELSVRFGVASGQVVLAGRDSSFAIGAVMNRAARLQSAAALDGPLIDLRTWLLVRDQVRCLPVEPVAAKGFDTALRAWTVVPGAHEPSPEPSFVNQRDLLARVTGEIAGRLREPGCSVIALDGEIGSGKTALLRRIDEAHRPAARIVYAECGRDDRDQGMWRLLRMDRELAGPPDGPGAPSEGGGASASTAEVQWRIRQRLAALSGERPVLVLVDNAQWAPDALLELADGMPHGCGPVVFVLAGREITDRAEPGVRVFGVPALSAEHSHRLLGLLRPAADLELHWADTEAIVERSGGNPLFLEQLAALAATGADDLVAPSASAALGARIDRLGPAARRVLGCIGAWGSSVGTSALAVTCGLEPEETRAALAELADHRLAPVQYDADGHRRYGCHSAAQVAYAHMPLGDRAAVHTAVARHLQRRAARTPAVVDLAVAQARSALECLRELRPGSRQETEAAALAASCLAAAARHAVGRSDVRRALDLAGQARSTGFRDPALALEVAAVESYALAACGRTEEALRLIDGAAELGPPHANPAAAFQLRANELALRPSGTGDLAAARHLAERAGDRHSGARLLLLEALAAISAGDYPLAERLLLTAYEQVRGAGAGLGTAEILANLGLCLAYGDSPLSAATRRCLELRADTERAPALHALVGCSAALLLACGGDAEGARRLLDESHGVFSGISHQAGLAGLHQFRAATAELAGDPARAAAGLRRAAAVYGSAGAAGAAAHCVRSAWVLDPAGAAPGARPPGPSDGWEAWLLHHQVEATRSGAASDPGTADAHLTKALSVITGVRGAGATLLPLAGCLRIARRTGSRELERQASTALDAACAARGAARPLV